MCKKKVSMTRIISYFTRGKCALYCLHTVTARVRVVNVRKFISENGEGSKEDCGV